ncbi:MAG: class I SAM-dependent methyltransferase [Silicimonas sp.]|nr:class I SAM-dependent methyltransferase [Silicimonas sp.]
MKSILAKIRTAARQRRLSKMTPDAVFSRIYQRNSWGDDESLSGKGSNLAVTEKLREELPGFLTKHNVSSMLDIPCGDFNWMRAVDLGDVSYIGADIVPELIEGNQKFADDTHQYQILDLIKGPLPKTDLVFTRDCLVHLSTNHIKRTIETIRASGATYLMTTTFPQSGTNQDILTGEWRPISLTRPPFSFPDPIDLILEEPPAGKRSYPDKAMGLWRVDDLPAT